MNSQVATANTNISNNTTSINTLQDKTIDISHTDLTTHISYNLKSNSIVSNTDAYFNFAFQQNTQYILNNYVWIGDFTLYGENMSVIPQFSISRGLTKISGNNTSIWEQGVYVQIRPKNNPVPVWTSANIYTYSISTVSTSYITARPALNFNATTFNVIPAGVSYDIYASASYTMNPYTDPVTDSSIKQVWNLVSPISSMSINITGGEPTAPIVAGRTYTDNLYANNLSAETISTGNLSIQQINYTSLGSTQLGYTASVSGNNVLFTDGVVRQVGNWTIPSAGVWLIISNFTTETTGDSGTITQQYMVLSNTSASITNGILNIYQRAEDDAVGGNGIRISLTLTAVVVTTGSQTFYLNGRYDFSGLNVYCDYTTTYTRLG